jgi:hypothetical protein
LHRHIEFLQNGNTRYCEGHEEIFESKYFPYKNAGLCFYCYEQKHSVILHVFRKKLGIKDEVTRGGIKKRNSSSDRFKRETDLETIKSYLSRQKASNQPIEFYYRQDKTPRKIYNYYLDERYINAKGNQRYYIKFLIDKIRKI